MRESIAETLIGIAVVAVGAVFLWYALDTGGDDSGSNGRYEVTARFNNVSGIARGSDVRLSGVKVGVVQNITPDFDRYDAVVTLALDNNLNNLPDDTDAKISQDGLLGGSYVALEPGGGLDTIPTDGTGEIIFTRGSVDLLTLVGSVASGTAEE
ncbi:MAG: MlaD family protein [Pseudomonadota bacterium]